ncbi:hypothetical protein ANO11243_027180 [Dothideomycetidae sp. 11243]|nr:hypothetical protein ANO11243_027180 [fungal sp. No.11243]
MSPVLKSSGFRRGRGVQQAPTTVAHYDWAKYPDWLHNWRDVSLFARNYNLNLDDRQWGFLLVRNTTLAIDDWTWKKAVRMVRAFIYFGLSCDRLSELEHNDDDRPEQLVSSKLELMVVSTSAKDECAHDDTARACASNWLTEHPDGQLVRNTCLLLDDLAVRNLAETLMPTLDTTGPELNKASIRVLDLATNHQHLGSELDLDMSIRSRFTALSYLYDELMQGKALRHMVPAIEQSGQTALYIGGDGILIDASGKNVRHVEKSLEDMQKELDEFMASF